MNDSLPYPELDENGKVICQICGKSFFVISPRHLNKHSINTEQYKLRFPTARLSSEQFKTKQKYVQTDVFKNKLKNKKIIEEDLDDYKDTISDFIPEKPKEEKIINKDNIKSKKVEIEELSEIELSGNVIEKKKKKIFQFLKTILSSVQQDYLIRLIEPNSKALVGEFITDFADPILKIDIEFPDVFWHNESIYVNPNRDITISEYGWLIIKVNGLSPSLERIKTVLKSNGVLVKNENIL